MAEDRVVGTAVLVTSGPVQWLYYLRTGVKFNGVGRDELPVMPEDGTPPTVKLPSWFPENRPWRYRIEGDILHVRPSVHIKDFWHNQGQWDVRFVMATEGTHVDHVRQLLAVNPDLDTSRLLDHIRERE